MTESLAGPNVALLQDEILGEIVLALQGVKDAGPAFLNSLSTLIEACVIHDEVWIDPGSLLGPDVSGGGMQSWITDSEIVTTMEREGVFKRVPNSAELDPHFTALVDDFDCLEFFAELRHTMTAIVAHSAELEQNRYEANAFLLVDSPEIFATERLTTDHDQPLGKQAISLVERGYPIENLIAMEGFNSQVSALSRFANLLGLNLYLSPMSAPHQLGAVIASNRIARSTYERMKHEFDLALETEIGHSDFTLGRVPAVTATVIAACKGDSSMLGEAILQERRRHTPFRNYLKQFEHEWANEKSRGGRRKLQAEIDNAIATLVKNVEKPRDRLLYKTWDIFKNPTRILQTLGDKLVVVGRKQAIVGQIKGIDAFWKTNLTAPENEHLYLELQKLVPNQAPEKLWQSAGKFQSVLGDILEKGSWSAN